MKYKSVSEYFDQADPRHMPSLIKVRDALKEALPLAKEVISYNMPAFKHKQILVYYAAFQDHIGFYPTPSGISAFQDRLTGLRKGKGSVQFPLDQPIPTELIKDIARYRWQEVATGA